MMDTTKFLLLKTEFDFISKRLLSKALYGNMLGVLAFIWLLVFNYFLPLFLVFGFITRYILRFQVQAENQRNENGDVCLQQDDQVDSKCSLDSDNDDVHREEETCFHSPSSTSGDQNREKTEKDINGFVEAFSTASTDLYEFTAGKDINGYMKEPKAMNFIVQELYADWGSPNIHDNQIVGNEAEAAEQEKAEDHVNVDQEKAEDHVDDDEEKAEEIVQSVRIGEVLEKAEHDKALIDHDPCEIGEYPLEEFSIGKVPSDESDYPQNTSFGKYDQSDDEVQSLAENCAIISDSEVDQVGTRQDHDVGSFTFEFLVYRNVGKEAIEGDQNKIKMNVEDFELQDVLSSPNEKAAVFPDQNDKSESSDDEYIELLEPQMQNSSALEEKALPSRQEVEEVVDKQVKQPIHELKERKFGWDPDDENESESIWDHEDIIEQLKLEIKNVRTGGLPTILEEDHPSECTKMVEGLKLKPLNIDEKLGFKDRMEEIHKVYKSYADKMRKLDILNDQTMHAIGFLQLKNQVKSVSVVQKSSVPIVKSLLSQSYLWWCKAQRPQPNTAAEPVPKFVGDLHKDLEVVYVGQVCLSWEILHWQRSKALELLQYDDDHGLSHQYNLVATEFQHFQVLLQRFIEDDPFQGPRVQHYVKNRCLLSTLLQVPQIKSDDCMTDNKHVKRGEEENDSIVLSGMLVKIIEESMRIFWKFLRKDERTLVLKGLQETQVIDHNDLELLMDIRKDLQKKEKRLKDIQRSGNCMVKKFQKHQEDGGGHALLVAQVELRLIFRVLNMSKLTTDQLVWCHEKLGNINFVHRKVHVEPSFLLFPC